MWAKLRKFGLEYCDLPTMLWNVSFLLRALTLNIDTRYKKGIPIFLYVLAAVIAISYFYVYFVSMLWFVFWRCPETGDLIAAMVVFSLGVSSEIGTVKLFFMFLYIEEIRLIVNEYLACDSLVVPGTRFSKNLLKTMRTVKKRAMLFWIVIISNGVIYIILPILLPGRHLMEDLFVLYGLEPIFETPNYQIAFLLMSAGVCFTCYLPANITAFLMVITGYTEAQMLALSEELIHLWKDAEENYQSNKIKIISNDFYDQDIIIDSFDDAKNKILNKYINLRLKDIIKTHAINVNLLSQIEHVFRGALAMEFGLLIVGMIAELLGGLENTYLEIPFALIQVGMDCLTGQKVMDANETFERAVYDCKWENFDKNNRKIVLLMLQSSQKTMKLSAGGLAMMSFSCFMSVIKSIYSAYTTLRTIMK